MLIERQIVGFKQYFRLSSVNAAGGIALASLIELFNPEKLN